MGKVIVNMLPWFFAMWLFQDIVNDGLPGETLAGQISNRLITKKRLLKAKKRNKRQMQPRENEHEQQETSIQRIVVTSLHTKSTVARFLWVCEELVTE